MQETGGSRSPTKDTSKTSSNARTKKKSTQTQESRYKYFKQ